MFHISWNFILKNATIRIGMRLLNETFLSKVQSVRIFNKTSDKHQSKSTRSSQLEIGMNMKKIVEESFVSDKTFMRSIECLILLQILLHILQCKKFNRHVIEITWILRIVGIYMCWHTRKNLFTVEKLLLSTHCDIARMQYRSAVTPIWNIFRNISHFLAFGRESMILTTVSIHISMDSHCWCSIRYCIRPIDIQRHLSTIVKAIHETENMKNDRHSAWICSHQQERRLLKFRRNLHFPTRSNKSLEVLTHRNSSENFQLAKVFLFTDKNPMLTQAQHGASQAKIAKVTTNYMLYIWNSRWMVFELRLWLQCSVVVFRRKFTWRTVLFVSACAFFMRYVHISIQSKI